SLTDFDTSREPRTSAEVFVRQNLVAERFALQAIDRLRAASCVARVIRLPQPFADHDGKALSATLATANSLILRNHAIVPDPMLASGIGLRVDLPNVLSCILGSAAVACGHGDRTGVTDSSALIGTRDSKPVAPSVVLNNADGANDALRGVGRIVD